MRKSFLREKDRGFNEKPEYYNTVEAQQFTDVVTPVQESPIQNALWKNFKTSHFRDVLYKGRETPSSEIMYDPKGESHVVQKVVMGRKVPIHTTKITYEDDKVDPILGEIGSPVKEMLFDKSMVKDIGLEFNDRTYKGKNLNPMAELKGAD